MKKYILALPIALAGCVSSQQLVSTHPPHIPSSASISIRQPVDGIYDGEAYPNSGATTARRLKAALIRYFPAVEISDRSADLSIKPTILRWEDRATEWSGKPDRVSISLQTYNRAGALLDATTIDAKSSWWTLGGDHPEDLLGNAFAEYANALSRASQSRSR